MDTFRRLFSCGPLFAKTEEEGEASKDVPVAVPPATKEAPTQAAVDDQAISAGVSADTAGAIEAAIEAAGSQVGAPAGAVQSTPPLSVEMRNQSFETPEEEQTVSTPPNRPPDAISASLD